MRFYVALVLLVSRAAADCVDNDQLMQSVLSEAASQAEGSDEAVALAGVLPCAADTTNGCTCSQLSALLTVGAILVPPLSCKIELDNVPASWATVLALFPGAMDQLEALGAALKAAVPGEPASLESHCCQMCTDQGQPPDAIDGTDEIGDGGETGGNGDPACSDSRDDSSGWVENPEPCAEGAFVLSECECKAAAEALRGTVVRAGGWAGGRVRAAGCVCGAVSGGCTSAPPAHTIDPAFLSVAPSRPALRPANGVAPQDTAVNTAGAEWHSGCLIHGGQVYFSPHEDDSTQNPTDSFICKRLGPPPVSCAALSLGARVEGTAGSSGCSEGKELVEGASCGVKCEFGAAACSGGTRRAGRSAVLAHAARAGTGMRPHSPLARLPLSWAGPRGPLGRPPRRARSLATRRWIRQVSARVR